MSANPQFVNVSQYELCKHIYTSGILNRLKLTPTTKLVLIALANHYNPHNKHMFPSQDFLASQLGISVKSVQRAVHELKQEGLVIYDTKKVNHYKFTHIFFELVKLSDRTGQIVRKQQDKLSPKQTHEHEKNKNGFFKKKVFNIQEAKYLSSEATRELFKDKNPAKHTSPMDDYETAKNWLASLSEDELKHSFIQTRVEAVKQKWCYALSKDTNHSART